MEICCNKIQSFHPCFSFYYLRLLVSCFLTPSSSPRLGHIYTVEYLINFLTNNGKPLHNKILHPSPSSMLLIHFFTYGSVLKEEGATLNVQTKEKSEISRASLTRIKEGNYLIFRFFSFHPARHSISVLHDIPSKLCISH